MLDHSRVQECIVNDMHLEIPVDFIGMFGHCRVAQDPSTYVIEERHMKWAVDHLPPGGVAVDVGASGGLFTAAFSRKCGPTGRVYAFEPARRARSFLAALVANNSLANVIIEGKAISDTSSFALFHELSGDDSCTWRPETSALKIQPENQRVRMETYEVPVATIDGYFADYNRRLDIMKIDIEGFEVQALAGGRQTIGRYRPSLCIDIHRRLDGDGDTEETVRGILLPLGYSFEKRGHVLLAHQAA